MLNCPSCKTEMITDSAQGVVTRLCPSCKGHWVHGRNIARLLNTQYGQSTIEHIAREIESAHQNPDRITCPHCETDTLHSVTVKDYNIEFCTSCYGVYLDDGEIHRLVIERKRLNPSEVRMSDGEKVAVGAYVTTESLFWIILGIFS